MRYWANVYSSCCFRESRILAAGCPKSAKKESEFVDPCVSDVIWAKLTHRADKERSTVGRAVKRKQGGGRELPIDMYVSRIIAP